MFGNTTFVPYDSAEVTDFKNFISLHVPRHNIDPSDFPGMLLKVDFRGINMRLPTDAEKRYFVWAAISNLKRAMSFEPFRSFWAFCKDGVTMFDDEPIDYPKVAINPSLAAKLICGPLDRFDFDDMVIYEFIGSLEPSDSHWTVLLKATYFAFQSYGPSDTVVNADSLTKMLYRVNYQNKGLVDWNNQRSLYGPIDKVIYEDVTENERFSPKLIVNNPIVVKTDIEFFRLRRNLQKNVGEEFFSSNLTIVQNQLSVCCEIREKVYISEGIHDVYKPPEPFILAKDDLLHADDPLHRLTRSHPELIAKSDFLSQFPKIDNSLLTRTTLGRLPPKDFFQFSRHPHIKTNQLTKPCFKPKFNLSKWEQMHNLRSQQFIKEWLPVKIKEKPKIELRSTKFIKPIIQCNHKIKRIKVRYSIKKSLLPREKANLEILRKEFPKIGLERRDLVGFNHLWVKRSSFKYNRVVISKLISLYCLLLKKKYNRQMILLSSNIFQPVRILYDQTIKYRDYYSSFMKGFKLLFLRNIPPRGFNDYLETAHDEEYERVLELERFCFDNYKVTYRPETFIDSIILKEYQLIGYL